MDEEETATPAQSSLEFITVLNPQDVKDAATRTKVKRHVMKDIGRSRRKPKKNVTVEVTLDPRLTVGTNDIDPFAPYPVEMGPEQRMLVSFIFTDENSSQRAMRCHWYNLGYSDEATFHIILANSAAHLDQARGHGVEKKGMEAEKYHFLALQSINQRMRDPNLEATEGLIGAVAGFLCHNSIIGDTEQWVIHIQGLEKLIQHRGGIETLTAPHLRESISWVELCGAFSQDIPTRFPLPPLWTETYEKSVESRMKSQQAVLSSQLYKEIPHAKSWLRLYTELVHFAELMQLEAIETRHLCWVKAEDAGGWTNVLMYRLLEWRPMNDLDDADNAILECLRISSLIYLAFVWRKFGVFPVRTGVYVDKLINFRRQQPADWKQFWLFEVWVLMMGAMDSQGPRRKYFIEEIRILAQKRSLLATDLTEQGKAMLWLPDALDAWYIRLRDDLENA